MSNYYLKSYTESYKGFSSKPFLEFSFQDLLTINCFCFKIINEELIKLIDVYLSNVYLSVNFKSARCKSSFYLKNSLKSSIFTGSFI